MSERFAELMESMHHEAFTKTRAKFKLSFGHYVTWCERHEGTCAFVVHVPEYRKFEPDAKSLLDTLAWEAAKGVVEEELKPGERLAVGLRGPLLYGSIMVGTAGADGSVGSALKTGTDEDVLYPFFDREHAVPAAPAPPKSAEPVPLPVDNRPIVRSTPPVSVAPPSNPDPSMPAGVPPYTERPLAEASSETNPSTDDPGPGLHTEADNPGAPPTTADGLPASAPPDPLTVPPGGLSRRRRPTGPRRQAGTPDSSPPSSTPDHLPRELPGHVPQMPQTAEEAASLLDSDDHLSRQLARSYLTTHKPVAPDSEVAKKLIKLLKTAKGSDAFSLTTALEGWVTADELPELEKLLDSQERTARQQLLRIIGNIKTGDAARILAKRLTDRQDRVTVSMALRSIGETAESAVIPFLGNKDSDVSLEACRIIQQIGTKKSVPGLMKLTKSKNILISTTAKMALDQVRGR